MPFKRRDTSLAQSNSAQSQNTARATRPDQLGALDLGSNSFHLIVAQEAEGRIQVLDKHKEMVRLAAGLDKDHKLSKEAQARALECLSRFGQRLRSLRPENVRIVGTNTLRQTESTDFIERAQETLGHHIDIISGHEEARLIYLGVCHDLGSSEQPRLVVDIGGGSTELIIGTRLKPDALESLYMGCVSMTQQHFADGKITQANFKAATRYAMVEAEPLIEPFKEIGWDSAVGTSGTINAVHDVINAEHDTSEITVAHLKALRDKLIDAGCTDKLSLPGLAEERKSVFPGGVAILLGIFEALSIKKMTVSQSALREGLIFDLIGRQHQEDARDETVEGMMARFGVDRVQARQVRETSIALLSQVATSWELTDSSFKQLISWAGELHEIGMDVSHAGYHKHGAYLIEHMDMPGFSRSDQAALALLVRGHRRKLLAELYSDRRTELIRLTILLRLAAVLHRNRSHQTLPHISAVAGADTLRLEIDKNWLTAHPLTEADLANEARYLASLDITLEVKSV